MYHFLLLWTFWPLSRFEIWIVFFFHKHSKWASSIGKFLRQSCFCAIKMMLKTKSDNVRQCKENKSPWNLLFLVHLLSRCRAARRGSSRTPGRALKFQIEQLWQTAEMFICSNIFSSFYSFCGMQCSCSILIFKKAIFHNLISRAS